jgi:hypothetical protein
MGGKAWIRDILSPSGLWTAFQYFCPASAAALSGWLSWLRGLPPSVSIGLALVAAACVVIIFESARKWFDRHNSHLQRISELEDRLRAKIKIINSV